MAKSMKGMMKGMASEMNHGCCGGLCAKCHGMKSLVIGLIFLINYYWQFADWWLLIGAILVIIGAIGMFKPHCSHCA